METLLTGASELLVQMGLPGLVIGGLAWFCKRQLDKVDASQEARFEELRKILPVISEFTEATKDLTKAVEESMRNRGSAP